MEKIRLKNGQEFDLIPMGITEREKERIIKFTSHLTYEEIKAIFVNSSNLEIIDYILNDGSVAMTYTDCVSLKGLSINYADEATPSDVYIVKISTDAIAKSLKNLQENITYTELAIVEIYEAMLGGL